MAIHPTHQEEEKLVRDFFGGETGFFVEVGANHPTEGSQTWHLEQTGWTGVLVEPQPDLAAFLTTARKAKVFATACSSPQNAGQSLTLHVDGARSALDRDRMAPGAEAAYTILVPVRTLDSILEEAEAPIPIDLLSVDVEGHETEVLSGFDFRRWQPFLILVEDHVGHLRTHRFLKASGYKLVRRIGNNGWYVPADEPIGMSTAHRWEILRKYYLALPFRWLRNVSRRVRRAYADWWAGR
ncbi:MAG: FkbM family methyltransferase [Alphaproteobacteria bacterium]|nr:FkbM family methyltransferase [Alphaproteobacteria bacterium]